MTEGFSKWSVLLCSLINLMEVGGYVMFYVTYRVMETILFKVLVVWISNIGLLLLASCCFIIMKPRECKDEDIQMTTLDLNV